MLAYRSLGFVATALCLSACNDPGGGLIAAFVTPEQTFVTAELDYGDISDVVPAIGRIETMAAVEVGSEISGRIVDLPVTFNQTVKAGGIGDGASRFGAD